MSSLYMTTVSTHYSSVPAVDSESSLYSLTVLKGFVSLSIGVFIIGVRQTCRFPTNTQKNPTKFLIIMHVIVLTWQKQVSVLRANSLSALSDTRDNEIDARQHHYSHDHPKYHQPHFHRLLDRGGQCWDDTHELQRMVIQLECIVDSVST